ncbi:LysR family transcriptional regulator [Thermoleophilia bacterium SCSIO 60948]|nr:LysR family transcriptional regulator [Thermoleophilia bacterium SCSIO 60948]
MDLRQLSYFVAVAEEGQFTRAAARVSVAQPAVSAQIGRLEGELGETLFHRGADGVRPTAAGMALLPHARAALAAAERGRDTIASLRGMLHGTLRIAIAGPVSHHLAEAIADFHGAHPAVEIKVSHEQNSPLLEAVAAGDFDAAIVGVGAQPVPSGVRTQVVATEPLVLAVKRSDPLGARRQIRFEELDGRPVITLVRASGLRTLFENACRETGITPRIVAEAGDLDSLVLLAAGGLGVALVPSSATEGADVAVVKVTRPSLARRTALAWNDAALSPVGEAFLGFARRRFGATGGA